MIYIDIEMPEYCWDCPCHDSENGMCNVLKHTTFDLRPAICPLKKTENEQGNQLSQLKYDFCPNCGAEMRGEKNNG